MSKRKLKQQFAISLLWAGNPLSVSYLRFMDLFTPIVKVKRLKRLL